MLTKYFFIAYCDKTFSFTVDNSVPSTDQHQKANKEEEKYQRKIRKQPFRPPCTDYCRQNCPQRVCQRQRISVWQRFWKKSKDARNCYMFSLMDIIAPKIHRNGAVDSSVKYHIIDDQEKRQQVCKVFFLSTLGYGPSASIIHISLKMWKSVPHSCQQNVVVEKETLFVLIRMQ